VQVEDETAKVPVGELTCLAQEARTAPHASAGAEARRSGRGGRSVRRALSLGGYGRLGTSGLTVVRRVGRRA
jgi:hypothetical protein